MKGKEVIFKIRFELPDGAARGIEGVVNGTAENLKKSKEVIIKETGVLIDKAIQSLQEGKR